MKRIFLLHKQNKGVSLMEMIVVVAIMSIIIGATSIGVGMLSTKPASQCASNIQLCLNRCRIHTMGKTQGFVAFYQDADGIYMVEKLGDYGSTNVAINDCAPGDYTIKRIGKKGVKIYTNPLDPEGSAPSVTSPVYYKFNRSDGALDLDTFGYTSVPEIYIEKGNKKYRISVQRLTGKVELNRV